MNNACNMSALQTPTRTPSSSLMTARPSPFTLANTTRFSKPALSAMPRVCVNSAMGSLVSVSFANKVDRYKNKNKTVDMTLRVVLALLCRDCRVCALCVVIVVYVH